MTDSIEIRHRSKTAILSALIVIGLCICVQVPAKVASSVTKAYYQLDGSRQLSELARRMNAASRAVEVKYEPEEAEAARANSEAEMLQAELEHRLAYFRLQQLIGGGY